MARWLSVERRWRDALLAATLPRPEDGSRPGLAELDLGSFYEELDAHAPFMVRNGFRAEVWSLSLAPTVPFLFFYWPSLYPEFAFCN